MLHTSEVSQGNQPWLFPCPVWEPILRKLVLLLRGVSKCWFGLFFGFVSFVTIQSHDFSCFPFNSSDLVWKSPENQSESWSALCPVYLNINVAVEGFVQAKSLDFSAAEGNGGSSRDQLIWLDNTCNKWITQVKMLRVTRRAPVQMNSACCSFPSRFSNLQMGQNPLWFQQCDLWMALTFWFVRGRICIQYLTVQSFMWTNSKGPCRSTFAVHSPLSPG